MPEATPRSLAIVIVSYNVRDELEACLRSLFEDTELRASEIVVVDNASQDDTVAAVRARWSTVRVIEAGGNIGFARANNLGIRATASEFVLLLNPDTLVPAGTVATLVHRLQQHPRAAAAGPRLVDGAGIPELSFGWTVGPLSELRQKVVGTLYNRRVAAAVRRVERWTGERGTRAWLSGACLLVRRTDLVAVGLLDERYFMYMEDVDLCASLGQRGRDLLFVPEAQVVHLRGRSAGRNPATERMRRLSQLAYYAKHHPGWLPILRIYLSLTGKLSLTPGA